MWEERTNSTDDFTPSAPFMECESLENIARELHNQGEFFDNGFLEPEHCDDDVAQEDALHSVHVPASSHIDPSSQHLLELVTSLADNLAPPGPDPCEMTRCDSWEFASLGNTEASPCHIKERSPSCTSLDSITQFDSFLEKLSQTENKINDEEIRAIECQCRRDDLQRAHHARVSMFIPRSHHVHIPERPRSASPTLPATEYTTSLQDPYPLLDSETNQRYDLF